MSSALTDTQALALRDEMQRILDASIPAESIDVGVSIGNGTPRFTIFVFNPSTPDRRHAQAIPAWLQTLGEFRGLDLDIVCEVL